MNIGSILPVGTIIHSMLTTVQFNSQYGDNWVLADGRSVTGTLYATVTGLGTIPDMRGRFLRGKNNGSSTNPDGDLSLGTLSADKFASHNHGMGANDGTTGANGGYVDSLTTSRTRRDTSYTDNIGGNETAPKSATVNIFIRIN